jgi:NAD-dependent SIR2 family protein deacetylase
MNVREVFCIDCYEWKKREDLVESQQRARELYCKECGAVLIRTDEYKEVE